ncbi:DUF6641 family protein [Colwellia sp. 12G3]|uniref:DUF6641 family protein n=1 Tax=Colwellia sp. 12G3 TaxID=2058299 RepID=UPI000C32AE17|nr:DUF6641 family protein [Colwellia sp. 12G3]PKI12947.1 hypothetical protein CXF71_19760 [Colwellia sp. 12G3]
MTKSLLSKLKVTIRPESTKANPLLSKRERLLTKLDQQRKMALCYVNDEVYTVYKEKWANDQETGERTKTRIAKNVRPWFYKRNNCYFFEVRYANKPMELSKGMHAIEVGDKTNLLTTIDTVIEAVVAGELDTVLTANAKPIKK